MAIFLYSLSFTFLPKMNLFLLKEKKGKKNTYVKITHPHHVQKSCVWQQEHRSEAKWHFSFLAKRARKKKVLLSQQLALNYWPLSVAATKGPLILETRDAGRTSPRGIWLPLPFLLYIGAETCKTMVGRTVIMGIRGRVVWRADRSECL